MELDSFRIKFREKLEKINIQIDDIKIEQFYEYMNLLIEWNKKINLTAITEPEDIILKHFIDSLTISKYVNGKEKIADIGTGAGFPGIPIKIINPNVEMVLIDSLNKRIKFLEEVITRENFENVYAIHARAEEIGHNKEYREKFDIVTSRAVARLNVLLEYMMPLLKIGGNCICLKGPNAEDELYEAKNALEILGGKIEKVEEIVLPDSDNKRKIIVIEAVKHFDKKYPRKAGVPTVSPL